MKTRIRKNGVWSRQQTENWMGILEFHHKIEYVFFCIVLMFLEEKEAEEQFVL